MADVPIKSTYFTLASGTKVEFRSDKTVYIEVPQSGGKLLLTQKETTELMGLMQLIDRALKVP